MRREGDIAYVDLACGALALGKKDIRSEDV